MGGVAQTLSIINPSELRLPPVKIPETSNPLIKLVYEDLAALVVSCTETQPDDRPSFTYASLLAL